MVAYAIPFIVPGGMHIMTWLANADGFETPNSALRASTISLLMVPSPADVADDTVTVTAPNDLSSIGC